MVGCGLWGRAEIPPAGGLVAAVAGAEVAATAAAVGAAAVGAEPLPPRPGRAGSPGSPPGRAGSCGRPLGAAGEAAAGAAAAVAEVELLAPTAVAGLVGRLGMPRGGKLGMADPPRAGREGMAEEGTAAGAGAAVFDSSTSSSFAAMEPHVERDVMVSADLIIAAVLIAAPNQNTPRCIWNCTAPTGQAYPLPPHRLRIHLPQTLHNHPHRPRSPPPPACPTRWPSIGLVDDAADKIDLTSISTSSTTPSLSLKQKSIGICRQHRGDILKKRSTDDQSHPDDAIAIN